MYQHTLVLFQMCHSKVTHKICAIFIAGEFMK